MAQRWRPDLIITVDNGISSIDGVDRANELGIDVVAFCGEQELKANAFAVKWLKTGEQDTFAFTEAGLQLFSQK